MAKDIHIVTAEYEPSENKSGASSPGDRCIVIQAFSEHADAEAFLVSEIASGDWGKFPDGFSWSDSGWWLGIQMTGLHGKTKSPAKKKSKAIDIVNMHRAKLGMKPLDLEDGWTDKELREMAESIRTTGRLANPADYGRGESAVYTGLMSLGGNILAGLGGAVSPGITWLGSIAGAAAGGKLFPPKDAPRGAMWGSVVGGLFGPLGAGIGNYIGTRKTDAQRKRDQKSRGRRSNPESQIWDAIDRLDESERRQLADATAAVCEAHIKAVVAELQGHVSEATRWYQRRLKAQGKMRAMIDRLGLLGRAPSRANGSLRRKLMR